MRNYFSNVIAADGFGISNLQAAFDAELETPELIDHVERHAPQIRQVMASLRESLPLVPHSGVGPIGRSRFYRLPNHYRSVSFLLPPVDSGDLHGNPGVIVFKGTEPLIADFPIYFDWMLDSPFRASALPLALHFPMDMKLPPAAMWIEECIAEQQVSSKVQQQFLNRHGRLAKLPLPLFVFKMTPGHIARYEEVIRRRLSGDAIRKIKNKLTDGLGVEVYYYPELPVRVADLLVGNAKETFRAALSAERVEDTFRDWTNLLAEMLCLGYMPYAPWHHGMGGCVDQGNACIDGGFNDLLTLIPFDSIPNDGLFRNSILTSIRMLSDSMVALAAVSIGIPPQPESDAGSLTATYLTDNLRDRIMAIAHNGDAIDERLRRFFEPSQFSDILHLLRTTHQIRSRPTQFLGRAQTSTTPLEIAKLA